MLSERWNAVLPGNVVAIDVMKGSVAVMIALGNGTGELIVLDGITGLETSNLTTPTPAEDVKVSPDGDTLAMVLPREVHFFNVLGGN